MLIAYDNKKESTIHIETIETIKKINNREYEIYYISHKNKKIITKRIPIESIITIHSNEDIGIKFYKDIVERYKLKLEISKDNEDTKILN